MKRSEKKALEHREEYLQNSRLILYFCKDRGMSDEDALHFSTLSIGFDSFQWFYSKVGGNVRRLKKILEKRLSNIEINRLTSMYHYVDPEETPES